MSKPLRKPRTLLILPHARESSAPAEKLAIRLRNEASTTGRCVCGATGKLRSVEGEPGQPGSMTILHFEHEHNCPVVSGQ